MLGLLKSILITGFVTLACSLSLKGGESTFEKQLQLLDWRPTQAPPGARYVGRDACMVCHRGEATSQQSTAMAHALSLPQNSLVLRSRPRLTFRLDSYGYEIACHGDRCAYTVTDGTHTISEPISYAVGFGVDRVGQTYVFQHKGAYYESRVSFFNETQDLDITIGHRATIPTSLEDALGRVLEPGGLRDCLGCHSTAAVSHTALQVDRMVPGITCEGCHGPGAAHVASIKAGNLKNPNILNPNELRPGTLVSFCGACHRTQMHVESMHISGVPTVRFQPYRLAKSHCYNPRDARISCLACHDPHENPQHDPAFYDSKCLACHAAHTGAKRTATNAAPACPVAEHRCVTCHMPKYRLAGAHFKFADHKIRVVRLGENFD